MFTFCFFHKPTNNTVHLRVTNNRRKAEMELGVGATKEEFEDALSASPARSNYFLSSTLKLLETKIKEVQMEFLRKGTGQDMDAKEIREIIRERMYPDSPKVQRAEREKEDRKLFGKYYETRMNAKSNEGYKVSIEYTYKKIKAFCADKDSDHGKPFDKLTFDDISLKWLNAFDEWLVAQGLSQNSRNVHFKNIRTVINRAIDEELTEKYPFRRFKIRPEATRKRSLAVEKLRRLFDYPVEEYQKFYLDMFKLIFMLCGINTADLYRLTEITDGRIEYRRAKTHKLYSVKVEPEAMVIIERWKGKKNLLCIADRWRDENDFNKYMNIALKRIGKHEKVAGRGGKIEVTPEFPEISSYWARHSWATIAADIDVPDAVISNALGHGPENATTEIYIRRNRKKVDEANRRVIDFVLYGKK